METIEAQECHECQGSLKSGNPPRLCESCRPNECPDCEGHGYHVERGGFFNPETSEVECVTCDGSGGVA